MKKLFLIVVSIFAFASCEKEGALTSSSSGNGGVVSNAAVLKYSGVFTSAPNESVSGTANVYLEEAIYKLRFENYIASGPDLKVFLSKTDTKTNGFISLGSSSSSSVYAIPSGVDLTQYKYVVIHCQQYNVPFGSALLTSK